MTRIDPGVVSPVAGLRAHERQAAEELGQWKTGVKLQEALSAATIALEISSRNARFQALQERWDRLGAGLDHRSFRTSVGLTPATLRPSDS